MPLVNTRKAVLFEGPTKRDHFSGMVEKASSRNVIFKLSLIEYVGVCHAEKRYTAGMKT